MANRNISVGVKIDGNAKGFKSASEDAKKASQSLKDKLKKDGKDNSQSFGGVINSLKGIPVSILGAGGVTAALSLLKTGMSATGEGADKLEQITGTLKGGYNELARAITDLDFSNFIQGIKLAGLASAEFINHMDAVNARISDFTLLTSRMQGRVAELKLKKSQGTITKKESTELVKLLEDQFKLEQRIYADAADDYYEYISTKLGLDKSLFTGLQQGVEDRAKLSREEIAELGKVNDVYAEKIKEFKKKFPDTTIWMTNALGQPMKIKVAAEEYNQAIAAWMRTLTGAQLAQLTEDSFLDTLQWQQLIGFYKKRNDLTNDYAALETKAYRAGSGKGTTPTTGHEIETIIPFYGSAASAGSLSQIENINSLVKMNEAMAETQALTLDLEGIFTDLFSSGINGWEEFGEAAKNAIAGMIVKLAALGATYAILSMFPGFAAFMETVGALTTIGKRGAGAGKAISASGIGSSGTNLKSTLYGRDILLSANRYSDSLIKNT